jgi:hypothetical protein
MDSKRCGSSGGLEDSHKYEYHTQNSRLRTKIWTLDPVNTKPKWYLPATYCYIKIDGEGGGKLLTRVLVIIDGVWIGWLDLLTPYNNQLALNKQYSAIGDLHNLQFTTTHALGFSAFTSRVLVTE